MATAFISLPTGLTGRPVWGQNRTPARGQRYEIEPCLSLTRRSDRQVTSLPAGILARYKSPATNHRLFFPLHQSPVTGPGPYPLPQNDRRFKRCCTRGTTHFNACRFYPSPTPEHPPSPHSPRRGAIQPPQNTGASDAPRQLGGRGKKGREKREPDPERAYHGGHGETEGTEAQKRRQAVALHSLAGRMPALQNSRASPPACPPDFMAGHQSPGSATRVAGPPNVRAARRGGLLHGRLRGAGEGFG